MNDIAKEYAAALFELAREKSSEKEFFDALLLVDEMFKDYPEYVSVLSSPSFSNAKRTELIKKAFEEKVPCNILSLLMLLCKFGNLNLFSQCVKEYEMMYNEFKSVVFARIVSVVELSDSEKESVVKNLQKVMKKTVFPEYETDKSIIGGLVIYMGDKVFDASLKTKLCKLKDVMKNENTHR